MASSLPFIDSVPYEIWGSILKISCLREEEPHPKDRYRTHVAPVTVSHVCATWRDIALSTPQFWTQISLRVGYHQGVPNVNLMDLFLERSKDNPLYVTLAMEEYDMEEQPDVHGFLVKLFENVGRWKTAKLDLAVEEIDIPAWRAWHSVVKTAPMLDSLDLRVSPFERNGELVLPFRLWKRSPALTKLEIWVGRVDQTEEDEEYGHEVYSFPNWAVRSRIPYKQITHLMLQAGPSTFISWEDIASIFGTASNLVTCFLEGVGAPDSSNSLQAPIILKHLRHLYLEAGVADNIHYLLTPELNRTLTAPSLKALTFVNGATENPSERNWQQDPYTEFINRSSCSLEDFYLINIEMSSDDLIECLQLSPKLKSAYWQLVDVEIREVSDRMTEWDATLNEFVICPSLEKLSVYAPYYSNAVVHMIDMFKKRLCPPDGSAATFTSVGLSKYHIRDARSGLQPLVDGPWCLRIIQDDYSIPYIIRRTLWNRYGGE